MVQGAAMIVREERIGDCRLILGNCMSVMPLLGRVDACVTDPPYGINADGAAQQAAQSRIKAAGKSKAGRGWKLYKDTEWDKERPSIEIFNLIRSISSEQIIWGGNYFTDYLPPSMRWLIWDKGQRDFSLADCEVAWTSQNKAMRVFDYSRGKALQDGKQHPTQKPIALMEWCLGFLPNAQTILDPFMGSGTTLVACAKMGRKGIGIELDPEYFDIACRRVEAAYAQPDLFIAPPAKPTQDTLL